MSNQIFNRKTKKIKKERKTNKIITTLHSEGLEPISANHLNHTNIDLPNCPNYHPKNVVSREYRTHAVSFWIFENRVAFNRVKINAVDNWVLKSTENKLQKKIEIDIHKFAKIIIKMCHMQFRVFNRIK
jgi:hypothetical protein